MEVIHALMFSRNHWSRKRSGAELRLRLSTTLRGEPEEISGGQPRRVEAPKSAAPKTGAAPSRAILGSSRHAVCTHFDPKATCGCAVSPKAVLIGGAIVLNPGDGGCYVIVAPRIPCSRGRHVVLVWGGIAT